MAVQAIAPGLFITARASTRMHDLSLNMRNPPSTSPKPRPVFARHAASLLAVRETTRGPEILMGIRGAGHRFMPNRLVFPGGAVDRADPNAPAAAEPNPHLLAMLARNARPRLARALAIAAARELAEETTLTLADKPGAPPRLDHLHYLCRAVTPTFSPIRFNARFLIVDAAHLRGTPSDSHELSFVAYRPIAEALREDLMHVTRQVLERLVAWRDLPPPSRQDRPTLDVFRQLRWRTE